MEKPNKHKGNQKSKANQKQQPDLVEIKNEIILPNFDEGDYRGPTDFSNWVVPDRLLMGAYPKRKTLLNSLLEAGMGNFFFVLFLLNFSGITTFINLMTPKELERIEKFGPYFDSAKKMVTENQEKFSQSVNQLQYISVPIVGIKYFLNLETL